MGSVLFVLPPLHGSFKDEMLDQIEKNFDIENTIHTHNMHLLVMSSCFGKLNILLSRKFFMYTKLMTN